eukprot:COSAG01_NODE_6602_length_3585_cov_43.737522_3_plen_78_part_00
MKSNAGVQSAASSQQCSMHAASTAAQAGSARTAHRHQVPQRATPHTTHHTQAQAGRCVQQARHAHRAQSTAAASSTG